MELAGRGKDERFPARSIGKYRVGPGPPAWTRWHGACPGRVEAVGHRMGNHLAPDGTTEFQAVNDIARILQTGI